MSQSYLNYPVVNAIDPGMFSVSQLTKFWLHLGDNALGFPQYVPVIALRGPKDGPCLSLTSAIHGDELNGCASIQKLFGDFASGQLKLLSGTLIGYPLVNLPGAVQRQRQYSDKKDLNRCMPGKAEGNESEFFAHQITSQMLAHVDYLIDLHTASQGRINSHYIRANLDIPEIALMARLQDADIVLHEKNSTSGTFRAYAQNQGIFAITVELGNPLRFQKSMIEAGYQGICNALMALNMLEHTRDLQSVGQNTVYCERSYWQYTQAGGFLEVLPQLCDKVKAHQVVARLKDIFGDLKAEYRSPDAGIVIGKAVMPIGESGSRILHLGIERESK